MACYLGAGRIKKEDKIDYTCGIVLNKKVGDYVKKGEILAYIHSNDKDKLKYVKDKFIKICKLTSVKENCKKMDSVLKVIN